MIMSFKKILPLFLLLACICGMLPAIPADAVPTKPTISVDKTQISVDEHITFTISSDGSTNDLWMYRVDGQWTHQVRLDGTSYTVCFGWAGEYKALVEAWDETGSKTSDYVYFTVGERNATGSKPTYATIGCDKSVYKIGDVVTFSMSGDGERNTLWIYKPDGTNQYFQNAGTSYTYIPTVVGQYEAMMETWNDAGSFASEWIRFRVVDPNAPTTTISTTKATTKPTTKATTATVLTDNTVYNIGDVVTFSTYCDGTSNMLWIYPPSGYDQYFENVDTTFKFIPTVAGQYTVQLETWNTYYHNKAVSKKITFLVVDPNASTTKPTTTASTTKPTTAPTTKPTTVKPSGNADPCAKGHKYQNGYCIYCAKADPNYNPCAFGHTFENGWCVYCLTQDPRTTTTTAAPATEPATISPTTSVSSHSATVGDPAPGISPVFYLIFGIAAIAPIIIIIREKRR